MTQTLTRRLMVPAVLGLVALGSMRPAVASAPPLLPRQPSAALYPAGTTLRVTSPLSNFQKSCLWDLDCIEGGTPRTHTQDEDALGRVGGWLSFAEWDGKRRQQMTFTLFGSTYATPRQAATAAADFNAQLTGKGFGLSPFRCSSFVTGTDARQYCARYHEHAPIGGRYFSVGASEGTQEIELVSYANTRYQAFKRVTLALAQSAMSE